jgi:16S rRNA (uracil1498-N3)-methyltransferase
VPEVDLPITFADMAIKLKDFDCVVFPYECAVEPDIKSYLREQFSAARPRSIAAIVGGEGGFSKEEAEKLSALGVVPVTLGKRILRADTACAAVCAAILYEADELK